MRALGLVLAMCALVAAGCGGDTMEEASPPPVDTTPPAASDRPPAPAIEGMTLDGETVSLAELRGRPVFVNVWSSW